MIPLTLMRSCICALLALVAALLVSTPATAQTSAVPADAIHAPSALYDTKLSYFSVLGSFRTSAGAMRHLANLGRKHPELVLAVYPPRARGRYWIVVSAAYVGFGQARDIARAARGAKVQRDAYVWHLPRQPNGPLLAYGPSVAPQVMPRLLQSAAAGTTGSYVIIKSADNEPAIRTMAASIRRAYPQLKVAVLPPRAGESVWRIALAANVTAADAAIAVDLARRLGLSEKADVIELSAADSSAWLPDDPALFAASLKVQRRVEACFRDGSISIGQMHACAGVWITPETLRTCLGASADDTQLSLATLDACVPLPDRRDISDVLATLKYSVATELKLSASNYEQVANVDTLMQCAADSKDALTLQRCAMPSLFSADQTAAIKCATAGADADIAACIATVTGSTATQKQLACLKGKELNLANVMACGDDPALAAKATRVQTCLRAVGSAADQRRCFAQFGASEAQLQRAQCLQQPNPAAAADCAIRLDPQGAELIKTKECIDQNRANPQELAHCVVDNVGTSGAAMLACYSGGKKGADLATCLAEQDDRLKHASEMMTCFTDTATPASAMSTCTKQFLSDADIKLVTCFLDNHVSLLSAPATCDLGSGDGARSLKIASCVTGETTDATELARCVVTDLPNSQADVELAVCIKDTIGDAKRMALCAAPRMGGTAGAVAKCLAADPAGDPLRCVSAVDPSLHTAQRIYNCVSKGTETRALIANCTNGIVDAKTAEALGCAADAGGDSGALAACAGQALLPGEAGRLAGCAVSSQGGPTAFALCAAAPQMNAEWRIAAECAVSSGGNPVGFATCTGGRLTLRELSKCIGGKIGQDCFGPNNTIRKFYEGMWNDLTHGPGPNNEIVKGVRAVGDGAEHLGNEVKKEVGDRVENAKKRFEKPLDQPGKTFECVVTFFHSC